MKYKGDTFQAAEEGIGRRFRSYRTALWCLLLAVLIGHVYVGCAEGSPVTVYTSSECAYTSCDAVHESCVVFNSRDKDQMTLPVVMGGIQILSCTPGSFHIPSRYNGLGKEYIWY